MASLTPKLDLIRTVDALKNNPLTRQPLGRGQHIYAYCNIRTNQVIYSLTQILSPYRNLHQLPDAGNNTRPPKLRKDQWRPLWTLTLPAGFQGEAQGLAAWQRLNALRYMHELYWKPPLELARNYTEEEMEKIQDRLDDRGGSKKENVYDMIKRQKKKLRLRSVMDQKANSIADLAAVLGEQEEASEKEIGEFGLQETNAVLEIAKRIREGDLEKLEAQIENLRQRVKEAEKETPRKDGEEGSVSALRDQRHKLRREFRDAVGRKEKMEHALFMASMAVPKHIEPTPEPEPIEPTKESEDAEASSEAQNAAEEYPAREKLDKQPPPPPPTLRYTRFKHLRLPTHYYDPKITEPSQRTPELSILPPIVRRAREVLLPEGLLASDITSEPNEKMQIHETRTHELESMIQSSESQLAALRSSSLFPKQPSDYTAAEKAHWTQLNLEVSLWTDMISAYKKTRGTLRIKHPHSGAVVNLGADFVDNSPGAPPDTLHDVPSQPSQPKRPKGPAQTPKKPREVVIAERAELREKAKREAQSVKAKAESRAAVKAAVAQEADADSPPPPQQNSAAEREGAPEPPPAPPTLQETRISNGEHPTTHIPNPSFSMAGVRVSWQNVLDAEFAPAWPESVSHDWMGVVRHAAPKPGVEPSVTAQEYYASKKRTRREEVQKESVRKEVVKSVSSAILRELIWKPRGDGSSKRNRRGESKGVVGGEEVNFPPAGGRESVVEV